MKAPNPDTMEPTSKPTNPALGEELARHGLPQTWETIINRLYAQKKKYPCGAQTRFGGKARLLMEVAFRTWEDHFTIWTGGTWSEGGKVTHTFTLNHDGTIDAVHTPNQKVPITHDYQIQSHERVCQGPAATEDGSHPEV